MKLKGTVRRSDLEGGVWVLEGADGTTYQLKGGGEDLLRDGVKATVEGRVDKGAFGLAMVGPTFVIKSYSVEG